MRKSFSRLIFFCLLFFCSFSFLNCSPALAADKTIGVIMTGNTSYYREIHKAFTESLSSEGINAEIVLQTPMPTPLAWANSARKLAAIGSDIIISYGAPATISTLKEVSDIPIVFAGVYDPVAVGVSGKNITGISSKVPVVSLLKNLKKISNFSTLGVVYTSTEKDTVVQLNEVEKSQTSLGFTSVKFNVRKKEDASKIGKVDALFLTTSCVSAVQCANNIIGIARQAKIPTASTFGGEEDNGVILTITANPREQGNVAAKMAAQIIKGAKPSSIAMEQPKKVDLIINIKEATGLGLKIPFDLLTSATKVIK